MANLVRSIPTLLSEVRPELEKEWHKNNPFPFGEATTGHKKYLWKCFKGHEWEASGTHRGTSKSNCPYCAGKKPTADNNLAVLSPHLITEWHPKNKKDPQEYLNYSGSKVWWICDKGHEWEAKIKWRTFGGNGCPRCKSSKGEKIVMQWLENNNIEYVHQYKIGMRAFDFYLPDEKIFIEIHGLQHFKETALFSRDLKYRQRIDREKQEYAETHGKYIMVDYREHKPELALERFIDQLAELA